MAENDKPSLRTGVTGALPANCAAILVYTTFPDRASAEALGRALVEEKLAGCVNILAPMTAIYLWEGALEQAEEVVLIAKTTAERGEACMHAIMARHPYTTPAVLALPVVAGATQYLDWIRAGTRPEGAGS